MKITNRRKTKLTKRQIFMAIGGMVAFLTFGSTFAVTASAEEGIVADNAQEGDVLFEDETDDYVVEKIDENDVVENNTVVEDGDKPVEETKPEDVKPEETKPEEEKKNDGGDCITEDHGYNEEAGKYWDPEIKTELEKKGLIPDVPDKPDVPDTAYKPDTPSTPDKPSTPSTPSTPVTPAPTPVVETVVTPAPKATPKTGDLSLQELFALYTGLGIMTVGAGAIAYIHKENKLTKTKRR